MLLVRERFIEWGCLMILFFRIFGEFIFTYVVRGKCEELIINFFFYIVVIVLVIGGEKSRFIKVG